jgi:hypothetical protein
MRVGWSIQRLIGTRYFKYRTYGRSGTGDDVKQRALMQQVKGYCGGDPVDVPSICPLVDCMTRIDFSILLLICFSSQLQYNKTPFRLWVSSLMHSPKEKKKRLQL